MFSFQNRLLISDHGTGVRLVPEHAGDGAALPFAAAIGLLVGTGAAPKGQAQAAAGEGTLAEDDPGLLLAVKGTERVGTHIVVGHAAPPFRGEGGSGIQWVARLTALKSARSP